MSTSMTQDKSELLKQLIDIYRKLLITSYTTGLAAARRFGPDIMDLAGRLHEALPAGGELSLLCDNLLDVMWKEYVINAKDINYYREKVYRESLQEKDDVLKTLMTIEAQWEQELLDEGDCGSGGESEDGEHGRFDDGSEDGADEEEEIGSWRDG